MNSCPPDVAKLTLFQYVKSPMGADLWSLLALNGPLNPDQWDQYDRWWLNTKETLHNKLGRRGEAPDWIMFVHWRSKLFMSAYLEIQKVAVINVTMVPLEMLIWNFTLLRNILIELKLVAEDDLVKPTTFFQKLATIGKYRRLHHFKNP